MDLTNEIPDAIQTGIIIPELFGYKCVPNRDPVLFDFEMYSGGFCQIYPLSKVGSKKKCIRLWIDDVNTVRSENINHVKRVSQYFRNNPIPYVIPYNFYDRALLLNNGIFIPGVVMDWIEGETLINFVRHHFNESSLIAGIASKFYKMVDFLNRSGLAHGDLSGDNIIVKPNRELCLVDYDSFFIPGTSKVEQPTAGIACYQHVDRKKNKYLSPNMDYFSQQVIYLSLLAIAKKSSLGNFIGDKELLFSAIDLHSPANFINSNACKEIVKTQDPELLFRLDGLTHAIDTSIDKVPSICLFPEHTTQKVIKSIDASLLGLIQGLKDATPTVAMPKYKSAYCPECGKKYYKSYSRYCTECGKQRK